MKIILTVRCYRILHIHTLTPTADLPAICPLYSFYFALKGTWAWGFSDLILWSWASSLATMT